MLAWVYGALVDNFPPINAILQEMVEGTAIERASAQYPAGRQHTLLASNLAAVEVLPQFRYTADCEILPKDQTDPLGLLLVDNELALPHVVAERDRATHPHASASRGRKLVADALAGQL